VDPLLIHEPDDLTLEAFEQVAFDDRPVALDSPLLDRLDRTRERLPRERARVGHQHRHGISGRHPPRLGGTGCPSAERKSGQAEEVVALIAFLLSDSAENMTGSVITTDGGWTAA